MARARTSSTLHNGVRMRDLTPAPSMTRRWPRTGSACRPEIRFRNAGWLRSSDARPAAGRERESLTHDEHHRSKNRWAPRPWFKLSSAKGHFVLVSSCQLNQKLEGTDRHCRSPPGYLLYSRFVRDLDETSLAPSLQYSEIVELAFFRAVQEREPLRHCVRKKGAIRKPRITDDYQVVIPLDLDTVRVRTHRRGAP